MRIHLAKPIGAERTLSSRAKPRAAVRMATERFVSDPSGGPDAEKVQNSLEERVSMRILETELSSTSEVLATTTQQLNDVQMMLRFGSFSHTITCMHDVHTEWGN